MKAYVTKLVIQALVYCISVISPQPPTPPSPPLSKPISEESVPVLCGTVPPGWKVEVLSDVTAKEGPIALPNSNSHVSIVVPLYQVVPVIQKSALHQECIILEPGYKPQSENPNEGTLSTILQNQITSLAEDQQHLQSIANALDKLSQLPQAKGL